MGAYNLLLVVTLLGLCAWCTMGMRGKSRGVGLSGNILPLEVELEGLELGDVREKAAAGGAFVGVQPWRLGGDENVYVLELEPDFPKARSDFCSKAGQGRAKEPFLQAELDRLAGTAYAWVRKESTLYGGASWELRTQPVEHRTVGG